MASNPSSGPPLDPTPAGGLPSTQRTPQHPLGLPTFRAASNRPAALPLSTKGLKTSCPSSHPTRVTRPPPPSFPSPVLPNSSRLRSCILTPTCTSRKSHVHMPHRACLPSSPARTCRAGSRRSRLRTTGSPTPRCRSAEGRCTPERDELEGQRQTRVART